MRPAHHNLEMAVGKTNTESIVPVESIIAFRENFPETVFPSNYRLISGIEEIYELQLAYLESKLLSPYEIVNSGAYFESVGPNVTKHFAMCTGRSLKLPYHSSSRLHRFFEKNVFKTGYGTHGLFPYRGKFHPQMVKSLLNIMGLKSRQTVLDPMMGSGTVCVEACLMGIDSIGLDVSPFCRFMTETKINALTMNLQRTQKVLNDTKSVFKFFQECYSGDKQGRRSKLPEALKPFLMDFAEVGRQPVFGNSLSNEDGELVKTYSLLLLAYLDAIGYAERSKKKSAQEVFQGVLERYVFVCEKIQKYLLEDSLELGRAVLFSGDARCMTLDDQSVDGILFSPPYSFAIDYVANDQSHLEALGVDVSQLRELMIGLRGGRNLADKYHTYQDDMAKVLGECVRVLKPNRFCIVVIGTNTNQISKALCVSKEEVQGLDDLIRKLGQNTGLEFIKQIDRSINGISNTMRREHIILMRKV